MTKTVICRKPGQWKWHKGTVLPLKMLTRGSLGTQKQQPYLQSWWGPASSTARWGVWSWRKHSSQDKVDGAGTTSHAPLAVKKAWTTSADTTRHGTRHLAKVQDSPLPIPSRLSLTFSQGPWKATIKETRILGYKQYKRNEPALGRHSFWCKSINRCGWRWQLGIIFF